MLDGSMQLKGQLSAAAACILIRKLFSLLYIAALVSQIFNLENDITGMK